MRYPTVRLKKSTVTEELLQFALLNMDTTAEGHRQLEQQRSTAQACGDAAASTRWTNGRLLCGRLVGRRTPRLPILDMLDAEVGDMTVCSVHTLRVAKEVAGILPNRRSSHTSRTCALA